MLLIVLVIMGSVSIAFCHGFLLALESLIVFGTPSILGLGWFIVLRTEILL